MNQLQFSQAQSPRESNFDFEEQPQLQEQRITENKLSSSIFNNMKILAAVYQILLILFNSYVVFDSSSKLSLLYITILHFLQVVRLAIHNYNNILNDHNCCLEIFWGILSISYYSCFLFFLENSNFPIQYPMIIYFVFTLSWFIFIAQAYRQNKNEKNIASLFTVFFKLLIIGQLMLINFRQINWLKWDWIYVFVIFWAFLTFAIILQIIFIFDFIVKLISILQENDLLNKQTLTYQIIGSLWMNLFILSFSGLLTFTIVSYSIFLSTGRNPFNSMPITLCIFYSLLFTIYTCYFRRTLKYFKILKLVNFQFPFKLRQKKIIKMKLQLVNKDFNLVLQVLKGEIVLSKIKMRFLQNYLSFQYNNLLSKIKLSQTYFQPYELGEYQQSQKQIPQLNQIKQVKRNKTDIDQPKLSNQNSLTEYKAEKDQNCFNCCQNDSCAVYMPCGHGGLCIKCATEWFTEKQECLICRKPVESVVKVIESNSNTVQIVDVVAF
ncbi:unnamed protein product [Paramecium sonneborni]|uniref:RING-type domain-containing protein n=1 Tax=Paramecium sonneborni TaxID=65129 RepID=A0A8S1MG39_9CILI|nr:unnamed protein product [Paramecium sonneborni]